MRGMCRTGDPLDLKWTKLPVHDLAVLTACLAGVVNASNSLTPEVLANKLKTKVNGGANFDSVESSSKIQVEPKLRVSKRRPMKTRTALLREGPVQTLRPLSVFRCWSALPGVVGS